MTKARFLLICAASLLILGFAALATPTQEADDDAATPSTAQPIGLLDVGYVFKNYPCFTELLAEMKTDVQAAEAEVKKKKEALAGLQKELKLHTIGTPEYAELERRIAMAQAELAGSIEAQKKVFVRREARLYYDAYQEIAQVVEDYARENNLALVLRFNDNPVNVNDPKDVLRGINSPVVWHDQGRDLTRIILQRLIQKSKEPEEGKKVPPEDPKEPTPKDPVEPKQENHHGESQRPSHLG